MIENILLAASILTAITVIYTFMFKLYKFFRNLEIKYDEMNDLLKSNTIHLLKIAVLDDKLPLTDRLHAGEQYIKMGGNGTIKRIYEKLLDEYEEANNI